MIGELRYGTPTSQWFWGYDDTHTGGVIGVFVDGTYTAGTTASADTAYTGHVEVTGLSSGTHSYQMALDGVAVGDVVSFRTVPAAGESVKVALWGCSGRVVDGFFVFGDNGGFEHIRRQNVDGHICLGDYLYIAPTFSNMDAGAIVPYNVALGDDNYLVNLPIYRKTYQYNAAAAIHRHRLMAETPFVGVIDNHEINSGGTEADQGPLTVGGTSSVIDAAHQAAREFFCGGRPENTATDDTLPTAGVLYTNWVWGDVEFVLLDRVSHSGSTVFTLGTNQVAWATSVIQNSTAKFIVIAAPTGMRSGLADYLSLLTAIDNANQTVVVVCSDMHFCRVEYIKGSIAPAKGVLQVQANPMRNAKSTWVDVLGGNSENRFASEGERADSFTLLECENDTLTLRVMNSWDGHEMAKFVLPAGSRDAVNSTDASLSL